MRSLRFPTPLPIQRYQSDPRQVFACLLLLRLLPGVALLLWPHPSAKALRPNINCPDHLPQVVIIIQDRLASEGQVSDLLVKM